MKNFVNMRVQAYSNARVRNLIKHDLRYNKNSLSQMNDNTNYVYCMAHEGAIESKEQNRSIFQDLKEDFENDKAKHNELYKARTRGNLRDYHSSWANGVITFSEKLKHSLATNEFGVNELKQVALKCLNEFAMVYKCDLKYVALHMDETTPHFHFAFSNFDKNGHSIMAKELKTTKQLSSLQDLAFKHFSQLGMERGISKEITKKKYQTPAQYWGKMEQEAKMSFLSVLSTLEDKERELLNLDSEIEKKIKSQARYERQIVILKERREQVKNDVTLTNEAKKQIYKEISEEQKKAREERNILTQEIKGLRSEKVIAKTSKRELRTKIIADTKNIIENSTKYKFINKETLTKNIHKILSKYSNLSFTIREIEEVNSHLEEAHKENDNLKKELENSVPKQDYINAMKGFEIKNTQNKELEKENNRLRDIIKDNGLDMVDVQKDLNIKERER